jgi:hypothetical protein
MTCKHTGNDPNCTHGGRTYYETPATPDSKKYEILQVVQVGRHLVYKVKYPNCNNCSYEGVKVMVFLNVSPLEAIRWTEIDPHFADPKKARVATKANTPAARFPASEEGWEDALCYAKSKNK